MLRPFIDPSFGPKDPKDPPQDYQHDPNDPYLWFVIPYLDSDKDGKVTVFEFYNGRAVEILRSIFDGLDVNQNNLLEKSEAIPENLFRPQFIRSITREIFKLADVNKDSSLSVDDVPLLYCSGWQDCHNFDPSLDGQLKLNKAEDYCWTLYSSRDSDKLHECKNQISTYLPLLDV